jgi:aspartate racemase
MASNTMHRVAIQLQDAIGIPLIHIVDPTADAATAGGATTLGLLGSAPMMEADFYRARSPTSGSKFSCRPSGTGPWCTALSSRS